MSALLLLLTAAGLAQTTTLPPDEDLRQIRTPRFVVVFPASAEADAQRAATALEQVAGEVEQSLGEHPRRLTVVLNNQYTLSNGYVTLAPRRSAWWTMPLMDPDPQVFGTTLPWLDALAVHEYRHVVQLDHARVGGTALAWALFGQQGWLIGSGLANPPWYLEGDAVLVETALTQSGRGRTPGFLLDLRTELLEEGIPSFSQAVVGSHVKKHADHYTLGYALTSYGASHFDPQLWSRVSEDASRWFFVPLSFSRQLRQEVGMTLPELHHLAMYELQRGWEAQILARGPQLAPRDLSPAPRRGELVDYASPEPQADGAIIAFRSGNEDPGSIVRIGADGVETRLAHTGLRPEPSLSARGGRVIWAETRFHPRWTYKSWSVLRVLDLASGELRDLTEQSRLFSPALSADGARVAAIEVARDGRQTVVVLDAQTGQEIQRIPAPDGERLRALCWAMDAAAVVMVRQHPTQGVALGRLDLERVLWEQLTPWGRQVLSDPAELAGKVYYVSGEAGAEDPWVLDRTSGQTTRLGSARHGAFSPSPRPDGQTLVYADARSWGRALVEVPLALPEPALPAGAPLPTERWLAPIITAEAPPDGDVLAKVEAKTWESRPYRRVSRAFHVHSWQPVLRTSGDLGVAVLSADETGSVSGALSGWYNAAERAPGGEVAVSWLASPVTVDLAAGVGARSVSELLAEDPAAIGLARRSWQERSLSLGLGLPLQGGEGRWLSAANLGLTLGGTQISNIDDTGYNPAVVDIGGPDEAGAVLASGLSLSLARQTLSASKELAPRLSQSLSVRWDQLLPGSLASGWFASGQLALGLPGLARMHRTRLSLGAEVQAAEGYTFSSAGVYPRGYTFQDHGLVGVASLDYALPFAYPDLGLGGWLYMKRLRADLFYDHGLVSDDGDRDLHRSVGVELIADLSVLRSLGVFGVGLQGAWLIDAEKPAVVPVFGGSF